MSGSWKRIGVVLALLGLLAAVTTTAASAHPDGASARHADVLNIMGFGTNGDDVAKSRFAEIFRESARAVGNGRTPSPPCHTVVTQFERLEQFRDQTGRR